MTTTQQQPDPLDQLMIIDAIYAGTGERPPLAPNHPSHDFNGFDGRCMWCDCRPFGRWAPHPCDAAPD
jgi:hypothetical protein